MAYKRTEATNHDVEMRIKEPSNAVGDDGNFILIDFFSHFTFLYRFDSVIVMWYFIYICIYTYHRKQKIRNLIFFSFSLPILQPKNFLNLMKDFTLLLKNNPFA